MQIATMEPEKSYHWVKIAESLAEIKNVYGNPCLVKAGGREICISIHNGEAYGCAARCPHAGGNMNQGWLDPMGNIVCPLHRYKFDSKSGRNTSGEGYFIKTYPVKEDDEGVFVGVERG
jgi:3-phenylpropionate/trans-cinnamate dioxygenase ferredoxin subunit